jgi:hypothetical protein
MIRSDSSQRLALSPLEEDVVRAVVTKFASDLALFRLSAGRPTRESAALEELATSAAMKLSEGRAVSAVESIAVVAILETVCANAPDEFFDAVCEEELAALTSLQMRRILLTLNRRLSTGDSSAAA